MTLAWVFDASTAFFLSEAQEAALKIVVDGKPSSRNGSVSPFVYIFWR